MTALEREEFNKKLSTQPTETPAIGKKIKCICSQEPGDQPGCEYPMCQDRGELPTEPPAPKDSATGEMPADVLKWIKTSVQYSQCTGLRAEGYEVGAAAVYHKMQNVIAMVTETSEGMAQRNAELGEEIDRLKASLEESRNTAKVFQEWYKRGDENIIKVTEEVSDYRTLLEELVEPTNPILSKYPKQK